MKNNNKKFQGVYTAIVTPFNPDETIDYASYEKLINEQIESGVAGIVVCGTTGESPTLSGSEQKELIKYTVEKVNKKVQVIAGTGSNNTSHAIEMTKYAESVGVDCALVVNPYYNKPTQEGLYRHFKAVANSVGMSIMVYNIKGRTGVNVETDTLLRLTNECDNIDSVKEASGDIDQMKEVIEKTNDNFSVLSGDDGITLDLIKEGGDGVVSVASNILPKEMVELVKYALNGEFEKAKNVNDKLNDFFEVEFIETNPIPIKAALSLAGKIQEVYRLPMCELSSDSKEELIKVLEEMGLI